MLLDPAELAEVAGQKLRARLLAQGAVAGKHRSRLHGASVEFAEHKEYSPGDEMRHIDWKVVAKKDRYYVRKFEQETQLVAYILLDTSGSMGYASPRKASAGRSKFDYALHFAAALGYFLLEEGDAVGVFAPAIGNDLGEPPRLLPARARPSHLHDLLLFLQGLADSGAKGQALPRDMLLHLGQTLGNKRRLIVVCSDLFQPKQEFLPELRLLAGMGHDVRVVQILDPQEIEFTFDELIEFESLESEQKLLIDPRSIADDYRKRMNDFLATCRSECIASGIEYVLAKTNTALPDALVGFFTAGGMPA